MSYALDQSCSFAQKSKDGFRRRRAAQRSAKGGSCVCATALQGAPRKRDAGPVASEELPGCQRQSSHWPTKKLFGSSSINCNIRTPRQGQSPNLKSYCYVSSFLGSVARAMENLRTHTTTLMIPVIQRRRMTPTERAKPKHDELSNISPQNDAS